MQILGEVPEGSGADNEVKRFPEHPILNRINPLDFTASKIKHSD